MERIGQTKSIYIPTKTEVWGTFTAVQKINIAKETAPCAADPSYSYTRCMKNHIAQEAGCHLDWMDSDRAMNHHERCVTMDQLDRYHTALTIVNKLSWPQLVNVTGCHAKCSYREFTFEKVGTTYILGNSNNILFNRSRKNLFIGKLYHPLLFICLRRRLL